MNVYVEKLRSIFTIEIPDVLLKEIIPLFKDGDENNWSVENVSYRFLTPLECPFYLGFYYIPGFSRYAINSEGKVITVKTGHEKIWTITRPNPEKNITGGYRVGSGKSDINKRKGLSRHRALCLTFKEYTIHPDHLLVNHLNGKPGEDRLDNLEMITPSGNIKHAYENGLFPSKVRPIDAHNWKSGEYIFFPTVQKCVEYTGICFPTLINRLKAGSSRRHEDGWRFKDKDKAWDSLQERVGQNSCEKAVVVRNIFTDEVEVFHSAAEAARIKNLPAPTIQLHCVTECDIPFCGYNFRYLPCFEGWPKYSAKQLEIFRHNPIKPGNGVEVYDLESGKELFFHSVKNAAEHFNLSPITISKACQHEKIRDGRFKFKYTAIK